ncbi:MAG: hypothetical protein IT363_14695 [Methanoregulaceae archaeon]|nr:hypothetical protein [Methanoregulaceae archaeon]
MRRVLSLLLLAAVSMGSAAEIVHGEMEVAFGWVRMPDGSRKDVTGMKFPYVAEKIEATKLSAVDVLRKRHSFPGFSAARTGSPIIEKFVRSGFRYGPEALQSAYMNDSGGYAVLDPNEFVDPSSLDDVTMTAIGLNRPWRQLTMGYDWDGSNSDRIIIRWRIWDNNVDMPDGMNDFTNELGDFGGYFTAGTPGTYKVTFGIALAGMVAPDTGIYVAQQFRTDQPNGEGPFRTDYRNVYSYTQPPQIGSSMNQWWFDWLNGGPDGIYENTEIDVLSEGYSNLLYVIEVESNSQQLFGYPNNVTVPKGQLKAGDFLSLWFDADDDFIRVAEARVTRPTNPVALIEIGGRLNSTSISAITLQASAKATRNGSTYQLQMYRYGGGTPGWVNLGPPNAFSTSFQPIQYTYGGTIPLNEFVNQTNRDVRARIVITRPILAGPISPIEYHFDKLNWLYISP